MPFQKRCNTSTHILSLSIGQGNRKNPTFRPEDQTTDLPLPSYSLTLERVKLVFPPISLEMQKSRHFKEISQSCAFVSSQVVSPILRQGPNPLLQHMVFFPSVTPAVREALMPTWLPRGCWHLKSPKHHFCTSNHPSIASRASWQTDSALKTVVLLHSLKLEHAVWAYLNTS